MPQRCGPAPEANDLDEDIRELHFGRRRGIYWVLFNIAGKTMHILRVRHSAQDWISPAD
jgi:plasmid stabilization system protein ParE